MTAPTLHLTREAERLGSDRQLRRAVQAGSMTRLATGVYVDTPAWSALDTDEQYRTRVHAAALASPAGAQFSHDSAAALWRLPSVGAWPAKVHRLGPRAAGGRSLVGVTVHSTGLDPAPAEVDGITVTSLARTVVDVAASAPFVRAVAMADAALAREAVTPAELLAAVTNLPSRRGTARAARVVSFADGLAESPGESLARVQFHALGYPPPRLQVPFSDESGLVGVVDFYWPELDLIVEFDGWSKYGPGRRFQRDAEPLALLRGEKTREDQLRRLARRMARIDWATTIDRERLAQHLAPFGLTPRRRPTR